MAYGQIFHGKGVDSIVIKKSLWGKNILVCPGLDSDYFDIVSYPDFIISDKEQISLLIDSMNSLKMIDSDYDKRYLGDIRCKLFLFKSDRVIKTIPMNETFLFTPKIRYWAGSLPETIDSICKPMKVRESRNSIKFEYLPYEGGKDALYNYLAMMMKKKMKSETRGNYNLWIVCHADKKGKTLDVKVFNYYTLPKPPIPADVEKKIKRIVYGIRWTKDKTRMQTDTIVIPFRVIIHPDK